MARRPSRIVVTWVSVAAVALGAGTVGLWEHFEGGRAAAGPAIEVASGRPSTDPIVARPAPAHLPTPVVVDGRCRRAIDAVRAVQRDYPSGAMLPAAANERLSAALGGLDAACATHPKALATFRRRELTPWLTYLPPGAGG